MGKLGGDWKASLPGDSVGPGAQASACLVCHLRFGTRCCAVSEEGTNSKGKTKGVRDIGKPIGLSDYTLERGNLGYCSVCV